MADSKISGLTALTGANLAATDVLPLVDISDTTQDASGTTKKITGGEFGAGLVSVGGVQTHNDALPTAALAQTLPRWAPNNASTVQGSGILKLTLVWLNIGTVVSNIVIAAANTGGSSLTHSMAGLYSSDQTSPVLLAGSADNTGATWTANTTRTFAMTSPYTVTASGYFYIGHFSAGTTLPTLYIQTPSQGAALLSMPPVMAVVGNSGLTTSLPNPATLGSTTNPFYAYVS